MVVPPDRKKRDTGQHNEYFMNNRLLDIIKYKTGGRQKVFAELLGWTPQYLAKLLRGENFGLQPVLTLLEKLPEINARWLLLGVGEMLNDDKVFGLRRETYSRVQSILMFDRFLSVMSPDEIHRFEEGLSGKSYLDFSDAEIARWEALLAERRQSLDARVDDAIAKSVTPCKRPKVKQS